MQNAHSRSQQSLTHTSSNGSPHGPSGAVQHPMAHQEAGSSVPSKLGILVVAGLILGFTGPIGGALAGGLLDTLSLIDF
jgi:hypothetical protein